MSLTIQLVVPEKRTCTCPECGDTHEARNSGDVYTSNIPHDLQEMAGHCGLREALWSNEDTDIRTARQLIPFLEDGIARLLRAPSYYKHYDAPSGWGKYIHFVPMLQELLKVCKEYPDAIIQISR